MKRFFVIIFVLCSIPHIIICGTEQFEEKATYVLQNPALKNAIVGIEIAETKGGQHHWQGKTLYSQNPEKLFVPASNIKIITALAGLTLLKPEYRFKTEVYWDSLNLYIKGYGDPSLCTYNLEEISEKIIEYGIKKIENIIYDDSYFDEKEIGEGWIEEDEAYAFNARISALSLNKNSIKMFIKPGDYIGDKVKFTLYPNTEFVQVINLAGTGNTDSLYVERKLEGDKNHIILKGVMKKETMGETFIRHIDKPSLYTATVFKEILQKRGVVSTTGIEVSGKLINVSSTDTINRVPALIYSHFSEPLLHLVYDMNKESVNFYADQILKTIGAELQGSPGSFEKGLIEIEKFLKGLGLNEDEFKIYDGSGLSRYNLISPRGIVKILLKTEELEINPEFLSSLSISGVDGTLKSRMRSSHSIGKVRAKTGTMMGISSLSGYAVTNSHTGIAFSIIINNYTSPSYQIKQIQDKIVELIITEL